MVIADQAHGSPMMVIAMMRAATAQPIAIHRPPKTIQSRLRSSDRPDMSLSASAVRAGLAKRLMIIALLGSVSNKNQPRREPGLITERSALRRAYRFAPGTPW